METVGAITELQAKDIVRGSVGVQSPGDLPAADEAVLSPQHNDGPVDQLHQELLRISYSGARNMNVTDMLTLNSLLVISNQLNLISQLQNVTEVMEMPLHVHTEEVVVIHKNV